MDPRNESQQEPQIEFVDGDDVLAEASGGKGVVRNPVNLGD